MVQGCGVGLGVSGVLLWCCYCGCCGWGRCHSFARRDPHDTDTRGFLRSLSCESRKDSNGLNRHPTTCGLVVLGQLLHRDGTKKVLVGAASSLDRNVIFVQEEKGSQAESKQGRNSQKQCSDARASPCPTSGRFRFVVVFFQRQCVLFITRSATAITGCTVGEPQDDVGSTCLLGNPPLLVLFSSLFHGSFKVHD